MTFDSFSLVAPRSHFRHLLLLSMIHVVIIPLFGEPPGDLGAYIVDLGRFRLRVVVVDNRIDPVPIHGIGFNSMIISNRNQGGIAGGFNRGVEAALLMGANFITLLDQDSRIHPGMIQRLREPLEAFHDVPLVVGPMIWDKARHKTHNLAFANWNGYKMTRLLISSGSTFRSLDWKDLGPFHEELVIDFVDHYWCFRAQSRGFRLIQHPDAVLSQSFGSPHPNCFCRTLGMQLYSPSRHYYSLRNLRWIVRQPCIPTDLKVKECIKMGFKPFIWLFLEPQRIQNLRAIARGITSPLPGPSL